MFKNYILLTLRTIGRQKFTSVIAILGLSIAIAGGILLYHYIDYQRSYDSFMSESSDVKRLITRRVDKDLSEYYNCWNSVSHHTAERIIESVPSIKEVTRLDSSNDLALIVEDDIFHEDVLFVDKNFFKMIPIKTIKGSSDLNLPNSVVLDRKLADKLFPDGNPIGKDILLREYSDYLLKVTGVVEVPKNSHLFREESMVFLPYSLIEKVYRPVLPDFDKKWNTTVYFSTEKDCSSEILLDELGNLKNVEPNIDDFKSVEFLYEDFKDIHLYSKDNIYNPLAPYNMIIILTSLTIILLSVSVINTISILIAQSTSRAREVGVRYVMGGERKDLIVQFLTEAILISLISLVVGLILAELLLPAYKNIVRSQIVIEYNLPHILIMLIAALLIGFISGLYPALYLSSLRIVESLKGKSLLKLGRLRKFLVILQFLLSSALLLTTLIFNNEVKFLKNIDVGFNRENLIYIFPGNEFWLEPVEARNLFKDRAKSIKGVESVSYSGYVPWSGGYYRVNKLTQESSDITYRDNFFYIDTDYIKTLGVEVIEGDLEGERGIILTEQAQKHQNLKVGDIVGKAPKKLRINAIVKDYKLEYPKKERRGIIHILDADEYYMIMIRITPELNIKELREVWESTFPNRGFEYGYISEEIQKELTDENAEILVKLLNITTILALFFTFLGLFSIILQNIKSRTKEIGVRKVLGADFGNIVLNILKEFIFYISGAVALGIPISFYITNLTLNFLYYPYPIHNKIELTAFTVISIMSFGISVITLVVLKSALSNPARALRYE